MRDLQNSGVFDESDIKRLRSAFDRSWRALAFAFPDNSGFQARRVRELLAERIIFLAGAGERDPSKLSSDALAWLPAYCSAGAEAEPADVRSAASRDNREE